MKVNCPECSAIIPAENINIQKMMAVCPACGAVFSLETPQAKAKRRKVYQPSAITVEDTDEVLTMAFRTNFRLSQHSPFVSSATMSALFTFLILALIGSSAASEVPVFLMASVILTMLLSYYWLASIVYNQTTIVMTDDKIAVSRKPLPVLDQATEVSLSGVTAFRYEETSASKREAYDLPRYNVWAETVDGRRRMVVKDMIEDYAVYIAQRLNERLAYETEDEDVSSAVDVTRLTDDETSRLNEPHSVSRSAQASTRQNR